MNCHAMSIFSADNSPDIRRGSKEARAARRRQLRKIHFRWLHPANSFIQNLMPPRPTFNAAAGFHQRVIAGTICIHYNIRAASHRRILPAPGPYDRYAL